MIRVRCFQSLDDLRPYLADWERLAQRMPLAGPHWLATWWQHYGQSGFLGNCELHMLAVFDEQPTAVELIGLLPTYLDANQPFQHHLRLLGSNEVCTDYLSVLHVAERRDEVATALAEHLMQDQRAKHSPSGSRWTMLSLEGCALHDPMLCELVRQLQDRGALARTVSPMNFWRLRLDASWDTYLARLSKSHRKQTRRAERDHFDSGRATWHTVESPGDFDAAWAIFVDLHQRRRRSLGQSGCFGSPIYGEFLQDAARQLLAAGQLRLHWLGIESRPAAAELHFADERLVYAYQSGIDPELLDAEPGRLATIALLQSAMAEGFEGIDFLRGDEPYKAHWRAEPVPMACVRILPGKWVDHARYGLWRVRDVVKQWAEPVRNYRTETASSGAKA